MKKINYMSIEIRSNGQINVFNLEYDLIFETDKCICIKNNEDLALLCLEKEKIKIYPQLENINAHFHEWQNLNYTSIYCNLYSVKNLNDMLKNMKKKISKYIHKNFEYLFKNDIDDIINSISLPIDYNKKERKNNYV